MLYTLYMALLKEQTEEDDEVVEYWIEDDGLIRLDDLIDLLAINNNRIVRRRRTDERASAIVFDFSNKKICAELEEALSRGMACKVIERARRLVKGALVENQTVVDVPNLTSEEIALLRAAATISGIQTRALCRTITTTRPCSAFRPDGNTILCGCEFVSASERRSTKKYYEERNEPSEVMRCAKPDDCSIIVTTELVVYGLQLMLVNTPRSSSVPLAPMQIRPSKMN